MEPPLWPLILLQVILLFLTGFFAAAELPLLAPDEGELNRQAQEGDRKAAQLLALAAHPARTRATVQLCVALCGFFSAVCAALFWGLPLGRWAAARWELEGHGARALAVFLVTLAAALVVLIFGYMVPRRISLHRGPQTARLTCGAVAALSVALRPLSALAEGLSGLTLRLLHLDPHLDRAPVSEEGIRKLVDIGEEKGAIESDEKEMIENIFEFNNMTAGDVMIHRTDMVMLWVDDTEAEIAETIETSGLSRFPVYEEDADDVIGILNTREWLLNARREEPKPLRELLRPAYFVPQSVRTDVLFRDMQSRKVHLSIVVDEYGGTAGLVTMEDLLEEIVGNIYDEFDPQEDQEIIPLGGGRWRIAGSAELEDIGAALEVEFPEDEETETLGGLVFAQLSVIPEDGSHPEVDAYGLHIRVEELTDRRVEWATVTRTAPTPAEESAPV